MKKSKQPKVHLNKKIFFLPAVLVLIFVIFLALQSYLNFRFLVSQSFVDKVDVFIGSLPLVPKTDKQVLKTGIYKLSQANSYTEVISLRVDDEAKEVLLQGDLEGGLDKTKEIFSANVKASYKKQNILDVELFQEGDRFIFKIPKTLNFLSITSGEIKSNYYGLNIKSLEERLKVTKRSDAEIIKDVNNFFKQFIGPEEINSGKLKSSLVDFGGETSYKFRLPIKEKSLEKYFANFENLEVDLYINKKTGIPAGLEIFGKGNGKDFLNLNLLSESKEIFLNLTVKLENVNKDLATKKPENVLEKESVFNLLEEINDYPTDAKLISNLIQKSFEWGADILTLERLLHVLLLTPTATTL